MFVSEINEVINIIYFWFGKLVSLDSLICYCDQVVGFCNLGCWDKFEVVMWVFDDLIDQFEGKLLR